MEADGYDDECAEDVELHEYFHYQLKEHDGQLAHDILEVIELRALAYRLFNEFPAKAKTWIRKYSEKEWDTNTRGPLPFDIDAWLIECFNLY